jgi:hypothetical protein
MATLAFLHQNAKRKPRKKRAPVFGDVVAVGKEEIPAEPFTGYARIDGRRVRKEIEGRLASPAPTATRKVMGVSYADAVRARRE